LFFVLALIPAALGVMVLAAFVRETPEAALEGGPLPTFRGFDRRFKLFLLVIFVFTLGNSSDAFLILRARNLGVAVVLIPIVYFTFNMVHALLATPVGALSDRIGRKTVIALGYIFYALVYLGFGLAGSQLAVWLLFPAYGFYYAFSEGIFKAFTADIIPPERRGTAFGLLNLTLGIGLLPAALIAGWLWQAVSPRAPFFFGSAVSLLALTLFIVFVPGEGSGRRGLV